MLESILQEQEKAVCKECTVLKAQQEPHCF